MSMYHSFYAGVLVDVDFLHELPERILAKLKDEERNIEFIFLSLYCMKNYINFITSVASWDIKL